MIERIVDKHHRVVTQIRLIENKGRIEVEEPFELSERVLNAVSDAVNGQRGFFNPIRRNHE